MRDALAVLRLSKAQVKCVNEALALLGAEDDEDVNATRAVQLRTREKVWAAMEAVGVEP